MGLTKLKAKMYKKLLAFSAISIGLISCYYGTGTRERIYTPEEFLNDAHRSRADYAMDSLQLLGEFDQILQNHEQSFYSKEYDESTDIIIDTIVYNKEMDKLGVFVIAKNATSKQLKPYPNHDWYYDATCYLGLRQSDSIRLSWIGPNLTNGTDRKRISAMIREACFYEYARKDTTQGGLYKYNLDDKRFWDGPIWNKKFPGID